MGDPDYSIKQQEKREEIWKGTPWYHHEASAGANWSGPLENTQIFGVLFVVHI